MPVVWKKFCFLIAILFAVAGMAPHLTTPVSASPQPNNHVKRARWIQPAATLGTKSKSGKKAKKKNTGKAKPKANTGPAKKKKAAAEKPTKTKVSAKAKASAPKRSPAPPQVKAKSAPVNPKAKATASELTVATTLTDDDIDNIEERGTSPWLYVFIAFVLACVGGMFFLNARRRQLEAARVNFRDYTSNHEVALSSKHNDLDMPAASAHETPTTGTLFARTSAIRTAGREPGRSLFGKLSEKATGLLKNSGVGRTKTRDAVRNDARSMNDTAASFAKYDEDTSFASITTISAVRSSPERSVRTERTADQVPVDATVSGTAEPMVANVQGEPCSFERYVEIQVATQRWRAREIPINQKLQEHFGINTEELIQYEFYWKQKISGNINLRKKFEELEPLYSAKYEAA